MADDAIRNLRALTRGDPTVADFENLERELYGASDRATVVMLGSILETSLRHLLGTLLRPDLTRLSLLDHDFGNFVPAGRR